MKSLTVRLDDCVDWGGIEATDEDRAAYEQAVAEAIATAYPNADVTVQCLQIAKPRAVATIRNAVGLGGETWAREAEIEEEVLRIAVDVWQAGEFWPESVART